MQSMAINSRKQLHTVVPTGIHFSTNLFTLFCKLLVPKEATNCRNAVIY